MSELTNTATGIGRDCCPNSAAIGPEEVSAAELLARVLVLEERFDLAIQTWARAFIRGNPSLDALADAALPTGREEIARVVAERDELRAKVADYERRIARNTTGGRDG